MQKITINFAIRECKLSQKKRKIIKKIWDRKIDTPKIAQ